MEDKKTYELPLLEVVYNRQNEDVIMVSIDAHDKIFIEDTTDWNNM